MEQVTIPAEPVFFIGMLFGVLLALLWTNQDD